MAITVTYDTAFAYEYDERGDPFPMLQVEVSNPANPSQVVTIDAYLDSGAFQSIFDGQLATMIGLDLLDGQVRTYVSTTGAGIGARVHRLILAHPHIGRFALDAGLSDKPIRRNLLGRDFFAFLQIGFRERQSAFYIARHP